jgi:hypothetical protein
VLSLSNNETFFLFSNTVLKSLVSVLNNKNILESTEQFGTSSSTFNLYLGGVQV